MNIKQVNAEQCTGCAACFNICPTDAISMQPDGEGFSFPVITDTKCINCGKCFTVCPALHDVTLHAPQKTYAVMGENSIRRQSSSGGMFTLLAQKTLEEGGAVCGARFSDDYKTVYHTLIDTEEELAPLRGSKYLQSEIGTCYRQIRKRLEEGAPVLFTGCPCQVAGLQKFLGKEYPKLLTCDLLCHGVSSPSVFVRLFDKQFGFQNIARIEFRTKEYGHDCTKGNIFFKDGTKKQITRQNCLYEDAFHSSKNLRKSCYGCKYAQPGRCGDISLGDWWGFFEHYAVKNDHLGTGLVLINTDQGAAAFHAVKSKLVFAAETDFSLAEMHNSFRGNNYSQAPRDEFFQAYTAGYADGKTPFDVGILGFWNGANYGSVLTYFALNTIINGMGYTTIMLTQPVLDKNNVYQNPRTFQFAKEHFNISSYRTFNELNELNNLCNTFLLGADQVFARGCILGKEQFYLLDFANDDKKKIAYASSFGHKTLLFRPNELEMLRFRLSRFDYLSVRELDGVKICSDLGLKAVFRLDPAFLCDRSEYDKLAEQSATVLDDEEYILAYILDPSKKKQQALLYAEKILNKKVKIILDAQTDFERNKQLLDLPDRTVTLDKIEDWFNYFRHASFVITDSFHGTCMAIIYNKNFISIENDSRGTSRTDTLKQLLNIGNKIVSSPGDILGNETLFAPYDFAEINAILQKEKEQSYLWLKRALDTPKKSGNLVIKKKYDHLQKFRNAIQYYWNFCISLPRRVLRRLKRTLTKKRIRPKQK